MASNAALARFSFAILVLSFVLVASAVALSARESRVAQDAARAAVRTQSVIAAAADVLQRLTDAETAARGYAISGSSDFLRPATGAEEETLKLLDHLSALVADQPEQQARARALEPLARARLAHLRRVIEGVPISQSSALALITSGEGRDLMDAYRLATARFEAVEESLLRERSDRMDEAAARTRVALFFLALSAAAFGVAAIVLAYRAFGRLQVAEARAVLGEARLRVTLRSCGDGIIATDSAGSISMINPVAQALTGWREDQALGLPVDQVFRIINENTRETVESPVGRVLREGKVVGLANHTVLIARDGTERPIDDSGAPIQDYDGEMFGVIVVFRDVSGRKASEAARERLLHSETERQAAISADRAKDDFLAIVSHELRAPLAAMRGWLDLLVEGAIADSEAPGVLVRIVRYAHLQERLISDLLDISRIRAGKLDVLLSPFDLIPTARDAVEACRSAAREKGLDFSSQVPDHPIVVNGDEDRISQVLHNLISNAIKFTPSGGTVTLDVAPGGGRVRISVSDTGIGLAADRRDHLFERFWQASSPVTRQYGGLGLGLAISKHIVEEHGGTVRVESEGVARGATFTVELPVLTTGTDADPVTETQTT